MGVKCEEYHQVCVISIDGDFTAEVCAVVRQSAGERIEQRHVVDFVIDLEKADFIDSEGLETLLWLKRRSEELFGRTQLAHLDDNLRKILEITRLEHRFECHADVASALKTTR